MINNLLPVQMYIQYILSLLTMPQYSQLISKEKKNNISYFFSLIFQSEMSKTVDQLLDSWFEVDEIDVKEEVARLEELIRC